MKKGVFVVIEGSDGSGKATQTALLLERLKNEGHVATNVDFPRYGNPSSFFVEKYLNGAYGDFKDIGPEKASLFYALDRFDASFAMKQSLAEGKIMVANRYVASNMGHQGSKIDDTDVRRKFFAWVHELEYDILGIPKPDLNIFLHVPATTAYDLIAKKAARGYINGAARDVHEADVDHLKRAEKTYEEMSGMFPQEFARVECAPAGTLLSPEEIFEEVWRIVRQII